MRRVGKYCVVNDTACNALAHRNAQSASSAKEKSLAELYKVCEPLYYPILADYGDNDDQALDVII